MTDEGYVKFTAHHTMSPPIIHPRWEELNKARTELHRLGLVGVTSGGISFGNVSIRCQGGTFLISGTATGAPQVLSPCDYCLVPSFDIDHNHVVSTGPVQASSESMTHGIVYNSCLGAHCVMHIHSKAIFDGMLREHFPATPENAGYGTPEIARAIGKCVQDLGGDEGRIVLAGHDEGVICYGQTVERAFLLIQELYNQFV